MIEALLKNELPITAKSLQRLSNIVHHGRLQFPASFDTFLFTNSCLFQPDGYPVSVLDVSDIHYASARLRLYFNTQIVLLFYILCN